MIIAKTKNRYIDELHYEHQLWASAFRFYDKELKIWQKRLEEFVLKNINIEFRKQIEHFQNQFIIQKEQLNILNHEITVHEQWLAKIAEENPTTIEKELFADHKVMREQTEAFHKIYTDLKNEFNNFLIKWMKAGVKV